MPFLDSSKKLSDVLKEFEEGGCLSEYNPDLVSLHSLQMTTVSIINCYTQEKGLESLVPPILWIGRFAELNTISRLCCII